MNDDDEKKNPIVLLIIMRGGIDIIIITRIEYASIIIIIKYSTNMNSKRLASFIVVR